MSSTLCWRCKNSLGFCSWSSELVPVKGWTAAKGNISYCVKSCPEFEPDVRVKVTMNEVAKMLGCSRRTLYRIGFDRVQQRVEERNLPLIFDETNNTFYKR